MSSTAIGRRIVIYGVTGSVCEGSYRRVRDITLAKADTVIWLRLPWRISYTRLVARSVKRLIDRRPLFSPNGPRESWRATFASRDSLLWWAIHHHKKSMQRAEDALREAPPTATRIILRTPAEVAALLQRINRQ